MTSFLITGGTGYFGQGFARRLLDSGLSDRVCIYSRGEYTQAQMRTKFGDDERLRFFIGDVRDRERLHGAMDGIDVVVHAAALKRIEVGHYNPGEMIQTNVQGAINVIEAAREAGVRRVVALSTDKAFEPISTYGHTKALMERLFMAADGKANERRPTRFAVTRYGNVAGSTGSVIPTWRAQLAQGQTVQVSDPECTRFWMSLDEAVSMVIEASMAHPGGELLMVPKLSAYRLGDLAQAMGATMNVRGLGKYEKRHEAMLPGMTSDKAPRMTVAQLQEALAHVE